ncbi:MAG: 50S ribosomal protein L13 [Gammaproteobacteria bacterium]|nr:50S ribosomal protein L13 [Gammaproteobacteria bacterium]
MATYSPKLQDIKHDWCLIDASEKTLGRLASAIAFRLRGKHKPVFTTHMDTGDYIVVTNVDKIRVTGNKAEDKTYYHHSGYPGGMKSASYAELIDKAPTRALELAVKGMLPKGPLGRQMFRKLKLYAGEDHPHAAQQPQVLDIEV